MIFIDGECVLCHGFAELLLAEDDAGIFKIASLQGNYANAHLPAELRTRVDSVALLDGSGEIFTKSNAVVRILADLGGIWAFSPILLLLPRFFRDGAYDLVARVRYRMFGKLEACRLPDARERERLLD